MNITKIVFIKTSWILLICAFLTAAVAGAQSRLGLPNYLLPSQSFKDFVQSRMQPIPQPAATDFVGNLRFESLGYTTPLADQPELNSSQLLSAKIWYKKQSTFLEGLVDLGGGVYLSAGSNYFWMKEAYLASNPKTYDSFQLSVGRRLSLWSELDSTWKLGLWQPKFAPDIINPIEQGLTGAFLNLRGDSASLLIFASPIFVPSMGPNVREKDGSLEADSRFYRSPQRAFPYRGKNTQIVYSLSIPELSNLVTQPAIASSFKFGNAEGFGFSLSVGVKPVNQLLLKYDAKLALRESEQPYGTVMVSPSVSYHRLVSADVSYILQNSKMVLSVLRDEPNSIMPDLGWKIQSLEPISIYGAQYSYKVDSGYLRDSKVIMAYMKAFGGEIYDMDDLGNKAPGLFSNRLDFYDSASLTIDGELSRINKRPLTAKIAYQYDFEQEGKIINTEVTYWPMKETAVLVGADILGPDDNESESDQFINQFRANDRIYGGLNYVF